MDSPHPRRPEYGHRGLQRGGRGGVVVGDSFGSVACYIVVMQMARGLPKTGNIKNEISNYLLFRFIVTDLRILQESISLY